MGAPSDAAASQNGRNLGLVEILDPLRVTRVGVAVDHRALQPEASDRAFELERRGCFGSCSAILANPA